MTPLPPIPLEDLRHSLKHTTSLWEEARGKSFFITGGTGFFGMWMLESFTHVNDVLQLGAHATVLTRDPAAFAGKAPHLADRPELSFVQGDIRDFVFPDGCFDYLIHAATEASANFNNEAPEVTLDAIVAGMRRILDFTTHAKVKKFLFTSSGAVYGRQPSSLTHVPEDYNGAPDCLDSGSAYGEGKRVAELMAAIYGKKQPCEIKVARCFAFVGPHSPLNSHFAIGNFIRDVHQGNRIKVSGDGTPRRSYLYAADLAIWLWTILFRGVPSRAYNIGSDEELSIADLAMKVNQLLGGSGVEIASPDVPCLKPSRYVPDVQRARDELTLRSLVPLDEAIRRTSAWWKSATS